MKRDLRTRDEILGSHLWDKLRAHPNAADLSIGAIRVPVLIGTAFYTRIKTFSLLRATPKTPREGSTIFS